MEATIQKKKLAHILTEVKEEKTKVVSEEEAINSFLDTINSLKSNLTKKTEKINSLIESFEQITWFDTDEEDLVSINSIIVRSRELHRSFIKQYVSLNFLRIKGIAKAEICAFKAALDDFREAYEDLASVFFILPNDPEFQDITKQLNSL